MTSPRFRFIRKPLSALLFGAVAFLLHAMPLRSSPRSMESSLTESSLTESSLTESSLTDATLIETPSAETPPNASATFECPLHDDSIPASDNASLLLDERWLSTIEKAYVWGWPMVYLHNVRNAMRFVRRPGISGGVPVAPINYLSMLREPVTTGFHSVPCPNPNVVYGFAILDLTREPVIIQIPDMSDHLWMFQVGDQRTDSFAQLGSMYGTLPGFYLIAGPDWTGETPAGIQEVFRSPTQLAYIIPRYFIDDHSFESLEVILQRTSVYPLRQYNSDWKIHDWSKPKWYLATGETNRESTRSVRPAQFFNHLREVIAEVPPLPGEEPLYQELQLLFQEADANPILHERLVQLGPTLEENLIQPLFDFQNLGAKLPTQWTTVRNGARFGDDYLTRTAVAKSNIFINRLEEAAYYYLEADLQGQPLRGDLQNAYELVFPADQLPPTDSAWSLTIYDANHHLVQAGGKTAYLSSCSPDWKLQADGSLRIRMQAMPPQGQDRTLWLPIPEAKFSLYLRIYSPNPSVIDGTWIPPALIRIAPATPPPSSTPITPQWLTAQQPE